jgi:predicted CXXCH cytochrome family protein
MTFVQLKLNIALLIIILPVLTINVASVTLASVQDDFEEDQCITCHQEIEMLPEGFQKYDVHVQFGLSCAGCHGGDPTSDDEEIAMSEANGFIGVPDHETIPKLCGKCHSDPEYMRNYHPGLATDQVAQYYTSVHGQKLELGDGKVATCINCHTSHSILSSKDPRSSVYPVNVPQTCRKCHSNAVYMRSYKIPSNQYELYAESVHGNHGATPPGLTSVTFICGDCHVRNMEFFRQTRMARAFEKLDFHGCEQCHGYHAVKKTSDNLVGVNKESFCVNCHFEGETGYDVAKDIKIHISKLVSLYDSASTKLMNVKIKGMNDIDIGFLLQEGRQKLIESRTLIHTFELEKVKEKTDEGDKIVKEAIILADKELDEYYTRRRGFAIVTVVLAIFAVGVYLKIRDIEKNQKSESKD